jgi:hypothetical protein
MGKGVVIIVSGLLLVVSALLSDCVRAEASRDAHATDATVRTT